MTLNDYLSLFPGFVRGKPRFMALAEAVLRQAADFFPVAGQLVTAFGVENAEGDVLDLLAASFGLRREDTNAGPGVYDDWGFRQYLLAKLALWTWDGTNEGVLPVLQRGLRGSLRDNADGTVTVTPAGSLPAEAKDLFPVPAGIRTIT